MDNHKLIITGVGKSEMRTEPLPEPGPGEVLLRVEACALCTWERYIYNGDEPAGFPFHGGHEIAGTVVACGPGADFPAGMPAAVVSWARCNACEPCRRGYDNHCEKAEGNTPPGQMWGPEGFAAYILVRDYEVFPLGDRVPVELGVLAEPLSCVTRAVRRSGLEAGDTAVVVGAGLMGLLFVQVLKSRGIRPVVIQRSQARRQLAARMGAQLVVDPESAGWEDQVLTFTGGRGAEGVFYTAGGGEMLNRILSLAAIGGSVVMYAPLYQDEPVISPDILHFRELSLTGSIRHDLESVRLAVRLLASGTLDLEGIRFERMDLRDFDQAVERANRDRDIHRILLKWNEEV